MSTSLNRKKALGTVPLLAAAVALFCLAGCAGTAQEEGLKPAGKTVASIAPPPPPPGAVAKDVVRSYYEEINADRYGAAWRHFSPNLQASQGGFGAWRSGYAGTTDTQLLSIHTLAASQDKAVEEIKLSADAVDACGDSVSRVFEGTWTLDSVEGSFVGSALDVRQTAGGELITDPSECAPAPAPPTTSSVPPAASCDPNYAGACLDPNSYDYDCAGGSGDGPDYTGPVEVVGSDPFGLDADGDGYACE